MRFDTIIGYTYQADILCPTCTLDRLLENFATVPGMFPGNYTIEDCLSHVAEYAGIDRFDETKLIMVVDHWKEAFVKYARHLSGCTSLRVLESQLESHRDGPCICGYADAKNWKLREFPKVIYSCQIDEPEYCGNCHDPLDS